MLLTSGLVAFRRIVAVGLVVIERGQVWLARVVSSFGLVFAGKRLATVEVDCVSLGVRWSGLFLILTILWCDFLTVLKTKGLLGTLGHVSWLNRQISKIQVEV